MIEKLLKQKRTNIAYISDSISITYGELIQKATLYADLLRRQGTSPVIIYGHKSINMLISIIACLMAKRTYIPIDLCMPINRLKKIIKNTKSTLLIKNEEIEVNNIESLTLNELIKYKNNILLEEDNNIAYIIFTSGSTGSPKGVPISFSNLDNFINWISNLEPLKEYKNIKVFNTASFSFDLSVADMYYSLCNGHTLISINEDIDNYDLILKKIKETEVNLVVATPTFIKLCLLDLNFNQKDYPSLKCIYFCGELLENRVVKQLLDRFSNINIINAYGPTEATSAVCAINITKDYLKDDMLPVGLVSTAATEIKIIDNEIVLKGPSVFKGYLNDEKIISEYYTGDIGYIDNDKLYCKGRKDNQIKYKGYRIDLQDIDNNVKKIRGVKDAISIAEYQDKIVKLIRTYVLLENKYNVDYVKKELKKLIPGYMMPKVIEKLEVLPINCNNKIDRKALSKL